jgi:uncharacterized protein
MTNVPPSFETARSSRGTKPSSRHDGHRLSVLGTNNEQCGHPCPIEGERSGVARGVAHAPLVASRARGDNRPDSDIDIMIEIDPEAHIGVFDDVVLKDYIAELFDAPVDVVSREGLKSYIRPAATAERDLGLQSRPTLR